MPAFDEKSSNGAEGGSHIDGTVSQKNVETFPEIDYAAEAKLDLMIIPPVILLYLLSFLDRVGWRHSTKQYFPDGVLGQHWKCKTVRPGRGSEYEG
jgi:hypothetical protein